MDDLRVLPRYVLWKVTLTCLHTVLPAGSPTDVKTIWCPVCAEYRWTQSARQVKW